MTASLNTMTERRACSKGGEQGGERSRPEVRKERGATPAHGRTAVRGLTQWFAPWIVPECVRGDGSSRLDASALCALVSAHVSAGVLKVSLCVCRKAPLCARSGAPIPSQWARAKALNDPDRHWPLPLRHCLRVCACVCADARVICLCAAR